MWRTENPSWHGKDQGAAGLREQLASYSGAVKTHLLIPFLFM